MCCQVALQNLRIVNCENCLVFAILSVYVRTMMLLVVKLKHQDYDTVKHRYYGHAASILQASDQLRSRITN